VPRTWGQAVSLRRPATAATILVEVLAAASQLGPCAMSPHTARVQSAFTARRDYSGGDGTTLFKSGGTTIARRVALRVLILTPRDDGCRLRVKRRALLD